MRKKSADHLEMLFENRNKAYGAYDLRANYESRLLKSFGIALLIAGFFFLIPFVLTKILTCVQDEPKLMSYHEYDFSQKFEIEKRKAVEQPVASKTKAISNDSYKIVKKDDAPKDDKIVTSVDPVIPTQGAGTGVSIDSSGGNPGDQADSIYSEPFSMNSVDVLPEFPGGEEAMMKFFSKDVHYPLSARNHEIVGRVYISFIIDENGKVVDQKVMRGLGYGTEEEVLRVVGIMPDWTPGKYLGRNVKTAFIMPFLFSLKNN